MVRRAFLVLGVGWAALLAVHLAAEFRALPARLAHSRLPAAERARLESGDPVWHGFLGAVSAATHGNPVVIFVDGGAGREEFLSFRAAFELYPAPVWVLGTPRTIPAGGGSIGVDPGTADWARLHRAGWLVRWPERDPGRAALARITGVGPSRLAVMPSPWPVPSMPSDEANRWREVAAWAVVAVLILALVRGTTGTLPGVRSPWDRIGLAMIGIAFFLALVRAFAPQSAWMNWDAWMIWDLKVKAVLQEGLFPVRYWHDPGYRYSHPEYPLGWPWLLAAVAKGAGGYDSRILRLVSPIFLPALGALCAALAVEVGAPGAAWLVAGAVTLLPLTVEYGSNGYVDLPLTVALTGAMMALLRARRGASRGALVGAWAGAVGWLKQEGLIAGAACVIALAWSARRDPRRSRVAGEAAVAWMAICGPWLVLRTWHHLGSEEFGAWTPALLAELPGRSWLILRALVRETLGPGRVGAGWLHHLPESWLLFWYVALPALVLGWRRVWRPGRRELAVVVAAQAATMVGAYLVTNWNPAILIGTSLDRLLLQMTPGLAILAAVAMSPESPPARGGRRGAK